MVAYIVTSGSYSDYGIEKVFLNKEKADKYCELLNRASKYRDASVEEHEIWDDKLVDSVDVIYIDQFDWNSTTNTLKPFSWSDNVIGTRYEPKFRVSYNKDPNNIGITVYLTKDKYTLEEINKMCQDKWAEFQNLLSEGWTVDMIADTFWNEVFKKEYDEGSNSAF